MTERTSQSSPPPSPSSFSRNQSHRWIILLSICLIMGLFYGLSFMDRPTLIIVHEFTNPLIDQIGSLGNALGKGETLVLIALGIGAVGLGLKSSTWKFAGLYMLLAHGLSGLTTQLLKHSLSRPRPRLMETVPWNVGFSLESGWDSFPSGHTSASFSVATVLAYYFPGGRMLWFGLAGYVGLSRVITGAHFPTDVLGGMLVGIGSGLVLVYARDHWKKVTIGAFVHGLPWLVLAYGMLWVLVPHPWIELAPDTSLFLGSMFVMTGLSLRLLWIRECSRPHSSPGWSVPTWPRVLMGVGLASSTGSLVIVGASLTAGIIWWMGNQTYTSKIHNRSILVLNPLWTEATWGIAMFFTTLLIFSIRSQLLLF